MKTCVIYFYESNKNHMKEDYESAYLCSFLRTYGECDVYMKIKGQDLDLNKLYDWYFIKIYNPYQFNQLEYFILENDISIDKVYFWGQYCRNNYEIILSKMPFCKGVILNDEYDTIACIMKDEGSQKGIVCIKEGQIWKGDTPKAISIFDIPKADRSILKVIRQKFAEVCFSRGCSKFCTFCTIGTSNKIDCKPNDLVVEELKSIINETSIREFVFKDLSFDDRIILYGKESYIELAQMILDEGLNIKFDVNFRVGSFSSENDEDQRIFEILRKSGMVRILLGVESFIQRDLKLYNKQYEVKDIKTTINLCRDNHIYPVCSFIFLNPYSSINDVIVNFTECYKLKLLDFLPSSLNVLRPEENSPLFNILKKDGLIYYGTDTYHLKWQDEHVAILAKKFNEVYYEIDLWRRFLLLSELHELVNELEVIGNRSKSRKLIESVKRIFEDVNEMNYNFLMALINDAMHNDRIAIDKRFELYIKRLDNDYCPIFRESYREIRKEIEIMKIIKKETSYLQEG